jgi:hypothetical protein
MPIPEDVVAAVVQEASTRMSDGRYTRSLVDSFVRAQPDIARYLSAQARELGGTEAVINAVFHSALMAQSFLRHEGRSIPAVSFADLDAVATGPAEPRLAKAQPALADYLGANVEAEALRSVLALIALGMDRVS